MGEVENTPERSRALRLHAVAKAIGLTANLSRGQMLEMTRNPERSLLKRAKTAAGFALKSSGVDLRKPFSNRYLPEGTTLLAAGAQSVTTLDRDQVDKYATRTLKEPSATAEVAEKILAHEQLVQERLGDWAVTSTIEMTTTPYLGTHEPILRIRQPFVQTAVGDLRQLVEQPEASLRRLHDHPKLLRDARTIAVEALTMEAELKIIPDVIGPGNTLSTAEGDRLSWRIVDTGMLTRPGDPRCIDLADDYTYDVHKRRLGTMLEVLEAS